MEFTAPSLPVHRASLSEKPLETVKSNFFGKWFPLQPVASRQTRGRCALQMFFFSHVLVIQPSLSPEQLSLEEYDWTYKASFFINKIWNHMQWWMGRIKLAFCCSIFILAHLYSLSCQVLSKICARFFIYALLDCSFSFLSVFPFITTFIYIAFPLSLCKNLSLVSVFCPASASILTPAEATQPVSCRRLILVLQKATTGLFSVFACDRKPQSLKNVIGKKHL